MPKVTKWANTEYDNILYSVKMQNGNCWISSNGTILHLIIPALDILVLSYFQYDSFSFGKSQFFTSST